jgi:hypothetical protein
VLTPVRSRQFRRDVRRAEKRGKDLGKLREVLSLDFSIVWPEILATTAIGAVYFRFALGRFRRVIFSSG